MMENIMPSITASCMVDNAITLILSSTILLPVPLTSYISPMLLTDFFIRLYGCMIQIPLRTMYYFLNLFRFRPVFSIRNLYPARLSSFYISFISLYMTGLFLLCTGLHHDQIFAVFYILWKLNAQCLHRFLIYIDIQIILEDLNRQILHILALQNFIRHCQALCNQYQPSQSRRHLPWNQHLYIPEPSSCLQFPQEHS